MLSYLQKFNELPKEIKNAVASPEAAARIIEIGKKYGVDLPSTIMRVMVKDIKLDALGAYLVNQFGLAAENARNLENDLRKYIFSSVIDYLLGDSKGPKLVFDEVDEKEVKKIQPQVSLDFDTAIEAAVATVISRTRIDLKDPLISGKFKQVIKTYLRGSRDKVSTIEALTKASELGGVALSRDAADKAIGAADLELSNLKKVSLPTRSKISIPEDKQPIIKEEASPFKKINRDVDYNLEKAIKSGEIKVEEAAKPIEKLEPVIDVEHELAPPVPAVRKIVKEAREGKPVDRQALKQAVADTPAPKVIVNYKTSASGKIRMDDIHFTPQVLSPVDELRYMSIKNFRRLDSDPVKATDKIKEKLEFLGREDYAKKIEGIVAWQDSPLNKLYLSLCRQALEQGRPIIDVLKIELQKNPESLRPDELSAIISLNRAVKF